MKAKYEIKTSILGPKGESCEEEISLLGRTLRWTSKGIEYAADEKHTKIIVESLGLENARTVATPGSNEEKAGVSSSNRSVGLNQGTHLPQRIGGNWQQHQQQAWDDYPDECTSCEHPGGDDDVLMDPAEATRFRGIAARLNYFALDRPDLQYAAKECCRRMATPMCSDWTRLKRVGRYLKGHARMVQLMPWGSQEL